MGLVQEIKSRLAPLAALHLRGARGNGREVTSVTTLIANSMLRSPPPAPPQCSAVQCSGMPGVALAAHLSRPYPQLLGRGRILR